MWSRIKINTAYLAPKLHLTALLNTLPYFALLNVIYAALVVDVTGGLFQDWWTDHRILLNLIPMWFFATLSICLLFMTAFLAWFYRSENFKLRFDFLNALLISCAFMFIGWVLVGLYLVHTYYMGDFWFFRILSNLWYDRSILSLPLYDIGRFPTLDDIVIMSYIASFGLLYFANYRAAKIALKNKLLEIKKPFSFLLITFAVIIPLIFWQFYNTQSLQPIIVMDESLWTQVMCWNFKDGLYPNATYWGNWSLVDGTLECDDQNSKENFIPVYIFPFSHGKDFILETQVMFIKGEKVEAHLLTRDSSNINFESGMVLFAIQNQATVRHMVNKKDFIYKRFPINLDIKYNKWYVMRFMIHNGKVKAFVDYIQIYASNETYPVGTYNEPHLAVNSGIARFKYVKIYEPMKR